MDDPLAVRCIDGFSNLAHNRQRLVERNRTLCDAIGERRTFDQLQDESPNTVDFFQSINLGDVRMIERREELRLTVEACKAFRVEREQRRKHLDRDIAFQPRIARAIDLSHSARAKFASYFVGTK